MVVGYFMTFYEYVLYQIHFSPAHTHTDSDNKIGKAHIFPFCAVCSFPLLHILSRKLLCIFAEKFVVPKSHFIG